MVSMAKPTVAGNTALVAKAKSTKAKKATSIKKPKAHPPYFEMIKEAIVGLKERTGSSHYAIAKFVEEKQGTHLPANFKKLLFVQLKKLVAAGKLVKVKNSFKLAAVEKLAKATAVVAVKAPAKKKVAVAIVKPRAVTPVKAKKVVAAKPKKVAKTAAVTSPGKKKVAAPVVVKKTPARVVKKPKSLKSPAKKAPVKKGKK